MNYKHKVTGHIASPTNSGKNYIVTQPQSYTIPKWIIENGNDWEKQPEFLFTTEDGIDIYEGDIVYGIYTNYGHVFSCDDLQRAKMERWKKFSTKEKAEEYVLMNKPCLSFNDVIKWYNELEFSEDVIPTLKQVVKSKL